MGPWGAPFIGGMPGMGGIGMMPGMGSPFTNIPANPDSGKEDAYVPSQANAKRRTLMGKILIGLTGVAIAIITFRSGLSKLFQPKVVKDMANSLREAKLIKVKENVTLAEKALAAAERTGDPEHLRKARLTVKRLEKRLFKDPDTEHLAERLGELRKVNKSPNSDIGYAFDVMGSRARNNKLVISPKLPKPVLHLEKNLQNKPGYFGKARHFLEEYQRTGEASHLEDLQKLLHEDDVIRRVKDKWKPSKSLEYQLSRQKDVLPENVKKYHELLTEHKELVAAHHQAPQFYPDRVKAKAIDFIKKPSSGSNFIEKDPWKQRLWEDFKVSDAKSFEDLNERILGMKEQNHVLHENSMKALELKGDKDALKTYHENLAKAEVTPDEQLRQMYADLANKKPEEIEIYHTEKAARHNQVNQDIDNIFNSLKTDQEHAARTARCKALSDALSPYERFKPPVVNTVENVIETIDEAQPVKKTFKQKFGLK